MKSTASNRGFTLIELVIVIVILGVLGVVVFPRFSNLSDDAIIASAKATGGAFNSAIQTAHTVWVARANGQPAENLAIYSNDQSGQLDFNANGWPSQQWFGGIEANPILNNVNDCLSVWGALFDGGTPTVSRNANQADYQAIYLGNNSCDYYYDSNPNVKITYNSNTGNVTVTTP